MADGSLRQAGMIAGLTRSPVVRGIAITLWPCSMGESYIADACAAMAQLRESGCDGVIAFGGGSVLDAAKVTALLVTNPDSMLAEMSETGVLRPRLPLTAIPTAAGTGSETANVAVIIDAMSGCKQVLAHTPLMSDVAILDAALTEGVPSHVTAMTGIGALTHAIEAYSTLNTIPSTDSLAIGAIVMIGKSLPKAVDYGHDLVARESMLLASYMTGIVLSSARLGLCRTMAYQPGATLHIPYGLANAVLLSTVMELNRMVCRDRSSRIGRALRTKKSDDHNAINAVSELTAEVRIGKRLGDVGTTSAHYDTRAQTTLENTCLRSNPRAASLEQIVGLCAVTQQMPGATLAASYPADGIAHIGRMRRSRRAHQWCGTTTGYDAYRVLSGLRDCTYKADKAFTPHLSINNN